MHLQSIKQSLAPAILRLGTLEPLDAAALEALNGAVQRPRTFPARREIVTEGQEITETLLVLSGWAARVRMLEDGRRQILNFVVTGELACLRSPEDSVARSTVVALTDVVACAAPEGSGAPGLGRVYALSRSEEEVQLLAQLTLLGRMTAQERIADLLLELLERLERAGLAERGRYLTPLTQEMLADALGLTAVHVNRTVQALRRQGDLKWRGREVILPNPAHLRRSIGRAEPRRGALP